MNVRRIILVVASVAAVSVLSASAVSAQDPFSDDLDPIERIKMFDDRQPAASTSRSASPGPPRQSVSALRQARALHRANQRVARLEHNLWIGYEPLRPRWNSIPMMSSRYSARRIIVPVYVWGR